MEQIKQVLSPKQMSTVEKNSEKYGVSLWELMQEAGLQLGRIVKKHLYHSFKKRVLILVGSGNNGGDGLVCADYLQQSGAEVYLSFLCGDPKTDLAKKAYEMMSSDVSIISVEQIKEQTFDIAVDCVFGTGFHGALPQAVAYAFLCIRADKIIACDLPSGCSASSGDCDKNTLKCFETVTFHKAKLGCLLPPSTEYTGMITVVDIKIPKQAECESYQLLDNEYMKEILPKRFPTSHKGSYGKLMCICGSLSFPGAAVMSASAALRCGVGLCCLCSTADVVKISAAHITETVYKSVGADSKGFINPSDSELEEIIEETKGFSAILFGCGIGRCGGGLKVLKALLENYEKTIILDADGINMLADNIHIIQNTKASIILTPHLAELARLCNTDIRSVSENRFEYSERLSKELNVTCVAKGAGTAIFSGADKALSLTGNSGLSRGGSGDLLAGMISSFAAQGSAPFEAACEGVYLHGLAADMVADKTSERGMLPSDIISELPLMFSLF